MATAAEKKPDINDGKKSSHRLSLKEIYWIFSYLKPYQRWFWPAIICMFFTAGLSLVWPYMISKLIGGSVSSGEIDVASVEQNLGGYLKITLGALTLQAFLVFWRILSDRSGCCTHKPDVVRVPLLYPAGPVCKAAPHLS